MDKKVIDFLGFKIERALRRNGFTVKKDDEKKVKLLLKINKNDQ